MFGVRSVRGVGNLTARAGRRFMGGSAEEAKHETFQWKKYSISKLDEITCGSFL
jgi:hypothetical protein